MNNGANLRKIDFSKNSESFDNKTAVSDSKKSILLILKDSNYYTKCGFYLLVCKKRSNAEQKTEELRNVKTISTLIVYLD
ncbi:MAG TPA: hypothetical protein PKN56_03670 [Leptospiraceae bacterium]|nr:hypothetical protein [Leptospiraceae bacterium]HNN02637.1 hypothetical protein [Leptospiraceae bacterium]